MIRMMEDWLAALRELGESFLDVLRAEVASFQRDVAASGRLVLKGARIVVIGLVLLFWLMGTLVFASVALLSSGFGLPLWQGALIVGGVLLVGVLAMRFWAVATFRRVKSPGDLARSHGQEHADWLKSELVQGEKGPDDGTV
jgi:hypothetical protein